MRNPESNPVAVEYAARAAYTAMTLLYGAPTPGLGSRYADDGSGAAHEARMLGAGEIRSSLLGVVGASTGEILLEATSASRQLTGEADQRSAAYLAPLVKADADGAPIEQILDESGVEDARAFAQAFGAAGSGAPKSEHRALVGALDVVLAGGRDAASEFSMKKVMLRDVMRFASRSDSLARDYASAFELSRDLARPAILASLSRGDSSRAAVVQAYIETLAEVPDVDVTSRVGGREAEEVSRMARGVVKAGGAHSRRGLEGISNLDGLLREDARLSPTSTEPVVVAAAYLVCVEHGPGVLGLRIRPTTYRNR